MGAEVSAVKHEEDKDPGVEESFEAVGDALVQILAASRLPDWDVRHRAAEAFGKAATDLYHALREAGAHPV